MQCRRRHIHLRIAALLSLLCLFPLVSSAQFKEDAFNQNYGNPEDTTSAGDGEKMFSFKEFTHGVIHRDSTLKIGTLFGGSTVFIGSEQIYNRQYWKLPIVYGGIGTTLGLGIHYQKKYNASRSAYEAAFEADPNTSLAVDTKSRNLATCMFASAGFLYWATLMDGVVNYKKDIPRQPGKATVYSILLPGLGQCYNGEFWKVPIYWGGLIGSVHYYNQNRTSYLKYKRIYTEITTGGEYDGPITEESALYYRNVFRRYRDYSVLAIAAFYLLQVIDANVFAYMQDFEVSDDLSMSVGPAVITPDNGYALAPGSGGLPGFSPNTNAVGFRIGLTF